ncbi:MAG: hypothetical protein U0441_01750 [Polyangiaceae bacterium]
MTPEEAHARLDAVIAENLDWARSNHRALREKSPHVLDSAVLLVVNEVGTMHIGCCAMDVMRARIIADKPDLQAAIEAVPRDRLRVVALGFGAWRLHDEPE